MLATIAFIAASLGATPSSAGSVGDLFFDPCGNFRLTARWKRGQENFVEQHWPFEANCPGYDENAATRASELDQLCAAYLRGRAAGVGTPQTCELDRMCSGAGFAGIAGPGASEAMRRSGELAWISVAMEERSSQMQRRCNEWKGFAAALRDPGLMARSPVFQAELQRYKDNLVMIHEINTAYEDTRREWLGGPPLVCPGMADDCMAANRRWTQRTQARMNYLQQAKQELVTQTPLLGDESAFNFYFGQLDWNRPLPSGLERDLARAADKAQTLIEKTLTRYDQFSGFDSEWRGCALVRRQPQSETSEHREERQVCVANNQTLLSELLVSEDPSRLPGLSGLNNTGCFLGNRLLKMQGTEVMRDFLVNAALVAGTMGAGALAGTAAKAASSFGGVVRLTPLVTLDAAGVVYDATSLHATYDRCASLHALAVSGVATDAQGQSTASFGECERGLSDQLVMSLLGAAGATLSIRSTLASRAERELGAVSRAPGTAVTETHAATDVHPPAVHDAAVPTLSNISDHEIDSMIDGGLQPGGRAAALANRRRAFGNALTAAMRDGDVAAIERAAPTVNEAKALLNQQGVVFETEIVDGREVIHITPERGTRLNNVAERCAVTRGYRLCYDPTRLIDMGAGGLHVGTTRTVYISHEAIAAGRIDATTLHELDHMGITTRYQRGEDSIFHGTIKTTDGGSFGGATKLYDSRMSLQELGTYSKQTAASTPTLKRLLRDAEPDTVRVRNGHFERRTGRGWVPEGRVDYEISAARHTAEHGKLIAQQSENLADRALQRLEVDPPLITSQAAAPAEGVTFKVERIPADGRHLRYPKDVVSAEVRFGNVSYKFPLMDEESITALRRIQLAENGAAVLPEELARRKAQLLEATRRKLRDVKTMSHELQQSYDETILLSNSLDSEDSLRAFSKSTGAASSTALGADATFLEGN